MKILFLTENFPPETNASATRVYERACYWAEDGHEVTVITCAPNFPQGRLFPGYKNRWRQVEIMSGIRVVRVKSFMTANEGVVLRTLDFMSFMVCAVTVGLSEKKPDVIAATSPQFFAAVGGWLLGCFRRVPFVFELSDLWPASIIAVGAMKDSLMLRLMEKLELFLYRRSAAIVALTDAFKENLASRGISADKIAVVKNGVDLQRYAPMSRDGGLAAGYGLSDRFVVGYVGTHGMAHALDNVLAAAEQLKDQSNIRFMLAGPGSMREKLISDAQSRGLDNVVFLPPQPKSRMPAVWSLCDVALVHLRNDPVFADVIPSKIFEAMAMGLPLLIAVPPGEATNIVEADGAGMAVAPESPVALAEAVKRLAADRTLRQTLGTASLAAAPRHSRRFQADSMMMVFKATAAGNGATAARYLTADNSNGAGGEIPARPARDAGAR